MFRDSLIILRKELRRIFTDRRMILFLVVLPMVLLPAMYTVMAHMGRARDSEITAFRSVVCIHEGEGNERISGRFVEALSEHNVWLEIAEAHELDSIRQSVADREIELLVVLPDSMERKIGALTSFDVAVYYNSTSDYSVHAYETVNRALTGLADEIVVERMDGMGIPREVLSVFTVNEAPERYDLATVGSVISRMISMLLPFFIIIYLFANSMKVGLDSVAGEKERGTLAVLLVNQVDRLAIVMGKMLSVMIAAIVGAASAAIGLIIGSRYFIGMFGDGSPALSGYSMSPAGLLQFTIVTVPLAVLVATIVLVVSTYARNTKEGQGMIMPVYLIVMVVGVAAMQTGDTAPGWMRSTPLFNSLIALKSVLMHDASWTAVLTAALTSMVMSGLLIYATLRMFSSEKVLFRV